MTVDMPASLGGLIEMSFASSWVLFALVFLFVILVTKTKRPEQPLLAQRYSMTM